MLKEIKFQAMTLLYWVPVIAVSFWLMDYFDSTKGTYFFVGGTVALVLATADRCVRPKP